MDEAPVEDGLELCRVQGGTKLAVGRPLSVLHAGITTAVDVQAGLAAALGDEIA